MTVSNNYSATAGTLAGNSSTTGNSVSATAKSSASAAYNTFLVLLTTQMQHQDPLNPTDTNQFTSEMIQLSSVEQQLNMNDTLDAMLSNLSSISVSNGLGYIGRTITANGSTTAMQDGKAEWNYSLPSKANNVTISVINSDGATVYQTNGNTNAGQQSFVWNGATNSGSKLTSGDYTLNVSATDGAGKAITTKTEIVGKVTGVDNSNGTIGLDIGDISVPIANVTQLK